MKGRVKKALRVMVLMAALICMTCSAAFASVDIHINGFNTTPVATYTTNDLAAFTQEDNYYSSYNCRSDSYKYYRAVGPTLADILDDAGVTYDSDDTITFYDGTDTSDDLTISSIMAGVYYATPNDNPVAVEPIIALQYCSPINGTLSSTDYPRNFHGQPSGSPGDDTMSNWWKNLTDINITQ